MSFVRFEKVVHNGRQNHGLEDEVVVLEKLDGANASLTLEYSGSRNGVLAEGTHGLRGWLETSKDVRKKVGSLLEGKILYGEWLVPHSVKYKEEALRKFYPFALQDIETQKFLPWDSVFEIAEVAGLETPQVFFRGQYKEVSQSLESYVGSSELTLEEGAGEGIVIFNEKHGYRTKVVSKKFLETNKLKIPKTVSLSESSEWALSHSTPARFEKILHKFIDEGVFKEEEFIFENFAKIASLLRTVAFEDMFEEEGEFVPEGFFKEEAIKTVGKKAPITLRGFIEERL